jgi:hypothetical protein
MLLFFFSSNRRLYGAYVASLLVFYGITFFTKDTTRVYALLSWAPTLHCLLHTWRTASPKEARGSVFRHSVVLSALAGWCAPRLFVWDGTVHSPWFARTLGQVLQGLRELP